MTGDVPGRDTLPSASALDAATVSLVRLSGVIAAGTEPQVRDALARAATECRPEWVEEVVLQSYLFCGFPRALNAAREWRRVSGAARPLPTRARTLATHREWRDARRADLRRGLRRHVREAAPQHPRPASGAGRVDDRGRLRQGAVAARRSISSAASCASSRACAAARQDRQLHSHLHGALNAGASPARGSPTALDAVAD